MTLRFGIACVFVILLSSTAHAQGEERARTLFEEGVGAFDREEFAEALRLFEESYELRPSQRVLYNIAVAERQIGRDEEALTHLLQWLDLDGGSSAERRSDVRAVVETLSPRLAILELTRSPEALTVYVDGSRKAPTQTGYLALRPGVYELRFEAEGHESVERTITLEAGERSQLTVELPPAEITRGGVSTNGSPAESVRDDDGGGLLFSWITGALTLGFAGLAIGSFIAAEAAYDDRLDTCAPRCSPDQLSEIETWDLLTTVGIIGAGVMGAATIVLALVELDVFGGSDEHQMSIGPTGVLYRFAF